MLIMKKMITNLVLTAIFFTCITATFAQNAVDQYGRLQVYGSHVCAQDGEQISLIGMSFFWSNWSAQYYNATTVDYLVDEFKVSVIRAAHGVPHDQGEQGNWASIEAVVDAAINRGIYVIIDWHTEGDAWPHHAKAVAFFTHMAQKYGNSPNVIWELWNEPTGQSVSSIRDWCQNLAGVIRRYDPDNLIICGSGTWSQYPNSYTISDPNVAYTFHGYFDDPANGANHRQQFYKNVDAAMNQGSAVFVTEFGANYGSTSGSSEIMDACLERKISMCAWSVNDKVEPWSIFTSGISGLTAIGNFYKNRMSTWPYPGSGTPTCNAVVLPAVIEAENYCYMSGVQKENCSEGGQNVGYFDAGDWIKFRVKSNSASAYTLTLRLAANSAGKQLTVETGTGNKNVAIPNTSGWQSWVDVNVSVSLPAGESDFAISTSTGGFNVNWFKFATDGVIPVAIHIEAESYSIMSGVQKENCTEGGQNVGWIDAGDWMAYNGISIPSAGIYKVEYRVASQNGGGSIKLEQNSGSTLLGQISVPATEGWQNWSTISHEVTLSAGIQNIAIAAAAGGFNINWLRITKTSQKSSTMTVNESVEAGIKVYPNPAKNQIMVELNEFPENVPLMIYDVLGKQILKKQINSQREQIDISDLTPGVYIVRISNISQRLIKQ
jgi:endoglucanase